MAEFYLKDEVMLLPKRFELQLLVEHTSEPAGIPLASDDQDKKK